MDRPARLLVVSHFVAPRVGGVESFVEVLRRGAADAGVDVRVLAGDLPGAQADVLVPTRLLTAAEWPLPTGGLRAAWDAVGWADAVLLNGQRHLLPSIVAALAAVRRTPALLCIHTAGDVLVGGAAYKALSLTFDRVVTPLVLRVAPPLALAAATEDFVRRKWHRDARLLPMPVELPEPASAAPAEEDPVRVVWAGRLAEEKAPLDAVAVVERLRASRDAVLDVYGAGPLAGALEAAAAQRPWLRTRGATAKADVLAAQAAAGACLATSRDDATQLSVLEPLALGVPVVCTDVGDAPLHAGPELTQFLRPPGDVAGLADALEDALARRDALADVRAANARRLAARHAAPAIVRQLLEQAVSGGTPTATAPSGPDG